MARTQAVSGKAKVKRPKRAKERHPLMEGVERVLANFVRARWSARVFFFWFSCVCWGIGGGGG